jgi:hypothetical protein
MERRNLLKALGASFLGLFSGAVVAAPVERRVFWIDVGNLPREKAAEYLATISRQMAKA